MSTLAPIPLDWNNIQTVFLDMDGTLLDLHFDNHFWLHHMPKRYAEHHQLSAEEAKQNLTQLYDDYKGELNWYCIDHWQEQLKMDIIALKHEVAHKIKLRGHVEYFLNKLSQRSCKVVLLTNAHPKTIQLKFSHTILEPYFDHIISAHELGLAKEQEGFWQRLQEHNDFDKKHSLFIDDNLEVLQCAKQYNVAHLLSIAQPDSQQAASHNEHFQVIQCFSQLC